MSTGDCNLCLVYPGDDFAEDFSQYENIAPLDFKCSECVRIIETGQTYQVTRILQEGERSTYRTCLVCAEIRAAFSCDGEMLGGVFWENLEEVFEDFNSGCLNKLKTPEAKRFLVEQWQKWKGLVK